LDVTPELLSRVKSFLNDESSALNAESAFATYELILGLMKSGFFGPLGIIMVESGSVAQFSLEYLQSNDIVGEGYSIASIEVENDDGTARIELLPHEGYERFDDAFEKVRKVEENLGIAFDDSILSKEGFDKDNFYSWAYGLLRAIEIGLETPREELNQLQTIVVKDSGITDYVVRRLVGSIDTTLHWGDGKRLAEMARLMSTQLDESRPDSTIGNILIHSGIDLWLDRLKVEPELIDSRTLEMAGLLELYNRFGDIEIVRGGPFSTFDRTTGAPIDLPSLAARTIMNIAYEYNDGKPISEKKYEKWHQTVSEAIVHVFNILAFKEARGVEEQTVFVTGSYSTNAEKLQYITYYLDSDGQSVTYNIDSTHPSLARSTTIDKNQYFSKNTEYLPPAFAIAYSPIDRVGHQAESVYYLANPYMELVGKTDDELGPEQMKLVNSDILTLRTILDENSESRKVVVIVEDEFNKNVALAHKGIYLEHEEQPFIENIDFPRTLESITTHDWEPEPTSITRSILIGLSSSLQEIIDNSDSRPRPALRISVDAIGSGVVIKQLNRLEHSTVSDEIIKLTLLGQAQWGGGLPSSHGYRSGMPSNPEDVMLDSIGGTKTDSADILKDYLAFLSSQKSPYRKHTELTRIELSKNPTDIVVTEGWFPVKHALGGNPPAGKGFVFTNSKDAPSYLRVKDNEITYEMVDFLYTDDNGVQARIEGFIAYVTIDGAKKPILAGRLTDGILGVLPFLPSADGYSYQNIISDLVQAYGKLSPLISSVLTDFSKALDEVESTVRTAIGLDRDTPEFKESFIKMIDATENYKGIFLNAYGQYGRLRWGEISLAQIMNKMLTPLHKLVRRFCVSLDFKAQHVFMNLRNRNLSHGTDIYIPDSAWNYPKRERTYITGALNQIANNRINTWQALVELGAIDKEQPVDGPWVSIDGSIEYSEITWRNPAKRSFQDPLHAVDGSTTVIGRVETPDGYRISEIYDIEIFDKCSKYYDSLEGGDRLINNRFRSSYVTGVVSSMRHGAETKKAHRVSTILSLGARLDTSRALCSWIREYSMARAHAIENSVRLHDELHTEYIVQSKAYFKEKIRMILPSLDWDTLESTYLAARDALKLKDVSPAHRLAEEIALKAGLTGEKETIDLIVSYLFLDPGPYVSDINFRHIAGFLYWYENLFVYRPELLSEVESLYVEPFSDFPSGQFAVEAWLPEFVMDQSIDEAIRHTFLQTIALRSMSSNILADDWEYPPYQLAEWKLTGFDSECIYTTGSRDSMINSLDSRIFPVSQDIIVNNDMSIASIRLFATGVLRSDISVNLNVNGEIVSGTTEVLSDGFIDIPLMKNLGVNSGDIVTITIPRQEFHGSLWLCDLAQHDSTSEISPLALACGNEFAEQRCMYIGLYDSEQYGIAGWQKVGTRFETAIDVSTDILIGNAENYLETYFASNPDDKLPVSWIATTSFNSTNNQTWVEFKEFETSQTSVYSKIPDQSYQSTPVYVYGDSISQDLVITGLQLSEQENVHHINSRELLEIVFEGRSGILVLLTNVVPLEVFQIDSKGVPMIQSWIESGNQIISAGIVPFEYTSLGPNVVSTYDYLFTNELSSLGTNRLESLSVTSSVSLPTKPTYHDPTGDMKEPAHLDLSTLNSIQMQGIKPYSDGSITYVFNMALEDIENTDFNYQTVDVLIDDEVLLTRIAMDQFRDPSTGLGRSFTIYDNDIRLFVQHVGDIDDTSTIDAHYLVYLTLAGDYQAGIHSVELVGSGTGPSQIIYVHDLQNIIEWESVNRPDLFKSIQSQYQGTPEIGAGIFVATGLDIITPSWELSRESFTMNSVIGLNPTRTKYAIDLTKVQPYRVYSTDITGQYGEATIRVGEGLFTMLDMVPQQDGWEWDTLAELNYVLTGIIGDWREYIYGSGATTSFNPQANGPEFYGLLAEMNTPTQIERVTQAVIPDMDFKHDGHYANSFSTETSLHSNNATLDWSVTGSVFVNGTETSPLGEFSLTIPDVDIEADYLSLYLSTYDCEVSLNTTIGIQGTLQSGVSILELSEGFHTNLTLLGTATGESPSFRLFWLSTAEASSIKSDNQAHIESFISDMSISGTATYSVQDGSLSIEHTSGTSSIAIDIQTVRDPTLIVEALHWTNITTTNSLEFILYSGDELSGESQTITLTSNTQMHVDRERVLLTAIESAEFIVIGNETVKWTIDWFELFSDSDRTLTFENEVPVTITGDAECVFDGGTIQISTNSTSSVDVLIHDIVVDIAGYPYLHVTPESFNSTYTFIVLNTETGEHIYPLDSNSSMVFDISGDGDFVNSVGFRVQSDGLNRVLAIDTVAFSPLATPLDLRQQVDIYYSTSAGTSNLILGEHLLSWGTGMVLLENETMSLVRTETQVVEWTDSFIAVQQTSINSNDTLNAVFWFDGTVDLSPSSDMDMRFVLWDSPTKYSDSFGVVSSEIMSDIIRSPTFAALYSDGLGFGVVGLVDEQVIASVNEGSFLIDVVANDTIILIPMLEERFELISGVEVDPNFIVSIQHIDHSGLLSEWTGVLETQTAAFWDGQFSEDYALYENFDSQGSWIVDTDSSSNDIYYRTELACSEGKLDITLNANETSLEYVVLELNYLNINPLDFPFLRWFVEGDGSLSISLSLKLYNPVDEPTMTFPVVTYAPDAPIEDERNIYVQLMSAGKDTWTIQGVEIIIEEVYADSLANKTVSLDELHIYRIDGWELEVTANTTIHSTAESDGMVLTLHSEEGMETRLRKKFIEAINVTMNSIFQDRERTGFASQVNIRAVGSTASNYSIDHDNTNWAIVTEDIAEVAELEEIVITLTGGIEEEGLAQIDWMRVVEPFLSRYEWSSFADGTWEPWGGIIMMGMGYPPSDPQNEIDAAWTGSQSGQSVSRWSSYNADPGSFSNGGHLNIHDAVAYDYTTWTMGTLSKDYGWVNLHSDGTQYAQDCGKGTGSKYSQSFYVSASESVNQIQVYIKTLEDSGFVGHNTKWYIYSGTSSAPITASVLRSGSFDASSSYAWRTISFSSISNGWFWISIQGSYYESPIPDTGQDPQAPQGAFTTPYWRYANPSGSSGMRWWVTGSDSTTDFLVKVHKYQTISGSSVFSYGLRVNWHDATGNHYTPLTTSPQTVNHAGADDVWITSTDSGVTNINPTNVKTYYRRPAASVSASFSVDPDSMSQVTNWYMPNSFSLTDYGDHLSSIDGKFQFTKGSSWTYSNINPTGPGVSVVGNTVTVTNVDYGTSYTITFTQSNTALDLTTYWRQSDNSIRVTDPEDVATNGWSNVHADSGNFGTYTVYGYCWNLTTGDSATLKTTQSSYTSSLTSTNTDLDPSYTDSLYYRTTFTSIDGLTRYCAYKGHHITIPDLFDSSVTNITGYPITELTAGESSIFCADVDFMYGEDTLEFVYKYGENGTEVTMSSYYYEDLGGSTSRGRWKYGLTPNIDNDYVYYKWQTTTPWGNHEFINGTEWFRIFVLDDDLEGPQFHDVTPTSSFLDDEYIGGIQSGGANGQVKIWCWVSDAKKVVSRVSLDYSWHNGASDTNITMEDEGDHVHFSTWINIDWYTPTDHSRGLSFTIHAWDSDNSPAESTVTYQDIVITDDDHSVPELSNWLPNSPLSNEDAVGSVSISDDSGFLDSVFYIRFAWDIGFNGFWDIEYGGNSHGTFTLYSDHIDYTIYSSNIGDSHEGDLLYVKIFTMDNDTDRGSIDRSSTLSIDYTTHTIGDDDTTGPVIVQVDDYFINDGSSSWLTVQASDVSDGIGGIVAEVYGVNYTVCEWINGSTGQNEWWRVQIPALAIGHHNITVFVHDDDAGGSTDWAWSSQTYEVISEDDDTDSPTIVVWIPSVDHDQDLTIYANITDVSGVFEAVVYYWQDAGVSSASLTLDTTYNSTSWLYTCTVPASKIHWGDLFYAYVVITDNDYDFSSMDDLSTTTSSTISAIITDSTAPSIDSINGPNGDISYSDSNLVWLTAYEMADGSLVSHALLNYSIDGEWFSSTMGLVNTTDDSGMVYATLMGYLPLFYGSTIEYHIICFDHAGNSIQSTTFSITSIGDSISPEFIYARVVGAEPGMNGTLVSKWSEPTTASGISFVEVTISIRDHAPAQPFNMTNNPETDTWVFGLPAVSEGLTFDYYFRAVDNEGNEFTTLQMSHTVVSITGPTEVDAGIMNLIEQANMVGTYRTMFRVETEGVYGIQPIISGGVANITMWLDGQIIPAGAQVILTSSVHIIMVQITSGDEYAWWGIQLANMKSEEVSTEGLLGFNILSPAPSAEDLKIEDSWALSINPLMDYFGTYRHDDVDIIEGDFETGYGSWTQEDTDIIDFLPAHTGSHSIRLAEDLGVNGWIEYDYPNGTRTSALSFFYIRNYIGHSNVTISVIFTDGTDYNIYLTIEQVSEWTRCELALPNKDIASIRFEQTAYSQTNTYLRLDTIALVDAVTIMNSWDISLQSELSPHATLDAVGGTVTTNYAGYTEFLVATDGMANLTVEYDSGLSGVGLDLYHDGAVITTVNTTTVIPVSLRAGINILAFYASAENATQGALSMLLTRAGEPVNIVVLGQSAGLVGVTSEVVSPYLPILSNEWTFEETDGMNVTIADTEDIITDLSITMNNTDDLTFDYVMFANHTSLDIRSIPVLVASFSTDCEDLYLRYRAELHSAISGSSVWVVTEWVNLNETSLIADLGQLATAAYNTSAGEYDQLLSLEVWIADLPGDGLTSNGSIDVELVTAFKARVGYIYTLSPRSSFTSTLLNDFNIPSDSFTSSTEAFHGYGSAVTTADEPLSIEVSEGVTYGTTLTFMANSSVDLLLTVTLDGKEINISSVADFDFTRIQTLFAGWTHFELDMSTTLEEYAGRAGIEYSAPRVLLLSFITDNTALIDSVEFTEPESGSVTIPYWETGLHWNTEMLGFTLSGIDGIFETQTPFYSVDYDGVTYSTEDSSWYRIVSLSMSSGEDIAVVVQEAYSEFVLITDEYTISSSGHVSLERNVRKLAPADLYDNEVLMVFDFDVEHTIRDHFVDSDNTALLEFGGLLFENGPYDTLVFDIDHTEENVDSPYFSRDFSYVFDVDVTEEAIYTSDGDNLILVPHENTDHMWIEYESLSIPSAIANYLVFDVSVVRDCVGIVEFYGASNLLFSYNFTSSGRHTVDLSLGNTIEIVRIGAIQTTPQSVVRLDWLGIRDRAMVYDDMGEQELALPTWYYPSFVEPFSQMGTWETGDIEDKSEVGYNSGNLVIDGSYLQTEVDEEYHYVANITGLNIDAYKYDQFEIDYSISDDWEHANHVQHMVLIIEYVDSSGVSHEMLDGHLVWLGGGQQISAGEYNAPLNLSETVVAGGWITGLRFMWRTYLVGVDPDPYLFEGTWWIDQILIVEDLTSFQSTYRDYIVTESFTDSSDWTLTGGSGATPSTQDYYDATMFQVDGSATYSRGVNLSITHDSVLDLEISRFDYMSSFGVSFELSNGTIIEIFTETLVPTTDTIRYHYSLSDFAYLDVDEVIIVLAGTGYAVLDYLQISDSTGVYVMMDSTDGWRTTGCEITNEGASVVIRTEDTEWNADFALPEQVAISMFPTLAVTYILSESSSSPNIQAWGLNSAGDPVTSEGSCTDAGLLLQNTLIGDDTVHTLYLDLSADGELDEGTFYRLNFTGSEACNLTILSFELLSRNDDWERTGTSTSPSTCASDSSLFRLDAFDTDQSANTGLRHDVMDLPAGIVDSVLLQYKTVATDRLTLTMVIETTNGTYTAEIPASHSTRTFLVRFSDMSLDENITHVGIQMSWSAGADEHLWVEVFDLQLLTTPIISNALTQSFSQIGEDYTLRTIISDPSLRPDECSNFYGLITGVLQNLEQNDLVFFRIDEEETWTTGSNYEQDYTGYSTWRGLVSEYMTIQEVNYGGVTTHNENYNINNTSDVDSSIDKGIETNWGSSPWNIEEENTGGGGGSQVTFVGAGTGSGTTGTLSPAYPTGLQAGDLIILQVMVRDTSNTPTTPSGFTLLFGPDSNQNSARQWLYYRFSDETESGSLSISVGGTACKLGRMYAFRNVALASWFEDADYGFGTTDDVYANDVATTGANEIAVSFYFIQDNNEAYSFTGESGGDWIESVNDFETKAGADGLIGINTATMSTAGTISGGSFDMGRADPWGLRSLALIPATGADNYEVDFEYQWTTAPTGDDHANISIDLGTHTGTEDLKV